MINVTSQITTYINGAISSGFAATNILSFSSSFLFLCLISMDTIRFLRYFKVKYPENVLAIFRTDLPYADIIPNIQLEENPDDGSLPKIFQSYNISSYIFNNNGNMVIESLVYWIVGILVLIFVKQEKNRKNKNKF